MGETTISTKIEAANEPTAQHHASPARVADGGIASATVKLRRLARLDRSALAHHYFNLKSGVMLLTAPTQQGPQVIQLMLPGDVIGWESLPDTSGTELQAATAVVLARIGRLPKGDPASVASHMTSLIAQHARMLARQTLHAASLAGHSAEARLASLLFEFARRFGRQSADSIAYELPLSRREMASYLGLNADTLSRILSRLKARGTIRLSGRRHIAITNMAALESEVPYAGAILAGIRADSGVV